jgi:hypothetical protein
MNDEPAAQETRGPHPLVSRISATVVGLVTWGYYVVAGLSLIVAATLSLTVLAAFRAGEPENTREWPMIVCLWILGGAFAAGGWSFARNKGSAYCAFVAGVMALFFPIGTAIGLGTLWRLRHLTQTNPLTEGRMKLNPYVLALAGAGSATALLIGASGLARLLK